MNHAELKEVIIRIADKLADKPELACIWADCDDSCDVTTEYAVGEEG